MDEDLVQSSVVASTLSTCDDMKRSTLFTAVLFSVMLVQNSFVAYGAAEEIKRPNIVLILADDLGYGDLACFGAKDMRTPHIDALVGRGMKFDAFYANSTVCSPSRASLLSGRYPELVGVPGVIRTKQDQNWGYLSPGAVLVPTVLKSAGYQMCWWGNGTWVSSRQTRQTMRF